MMLLLCTQREREREKGGGTSPAAAESRSEANGANCTKTRLIHCETDRKRYGPYNPIFGRLSFVDDLPPPSLLDWRGGHRKKQQGSLTLSSLYTAISSSDAQSILSSIYISPGWNENLSCWTLDAAGVIHTLDQPAAVRIVAACVGQNRENPKKIKKYFTLEILPDSQPSSEQQLADIIHWLTLCWERAQVLLSVHGRLFARLLFSVFGYRDTRL